MSRPFRHTLLPIALAAAFAASGCQTDDAVERDTRDARKEVKEKSKKGAKDIDRAVEDVDGN